MGLFSDFLLLEKSLQRKKGNGRTIISLKCMHEGKYGEKIDSYLKPFNGCGFALLQATASPHWPLSKAW